jgi:hypothetical protein
MDITINITIQIITNKFNIIRVLVYCNLSSSTTRTAGRLMILLSQAYT